MQTFISKVMSLFFNTLSRFLIAFLQRSNCLLISWLPSPSSVILEPKKIKLSLFPLFPHLFALKWYRIHHVKCQAGWITSCNQECQEKYKQPQICRWYHPNGRKQENLRKTSASLTTLKPLTVDHNKLRKILKEMGKPDHLTCLLRNLCAGQEATARTRHGTMELAQNWERGTSRLYFVTLLI